MHSPVAWVVTSEIFPLEVRAMGVSITTAANWTGNFLVAMLTPVLLASPLQIHGTFYVLSIALFAAFLFVLLTLPETKVTEYSGTTIIYNLLLTHVVNILGIKPRESQHRLCFAMEGENTSFVLSKVSLTHFIVLKDDHGCNRCGCPWRCFSKTTYSISQEDTV